MTHPITPPPELVQQWLDVIFDEGGLGVDPHKLSNGMAARAAQWGADQELEACCKVLEVSDRNAREFLYAARRPKPPSLKERAQQALGRFDYNAHTTASEMVTDFALIRSALDALPDD